MYNIRNIKVKGHYRTYRKGSYPGPYKDVRKYIKVHNRKISQLNFIPLSKDIKNRSFGQTTMIKKIPDNLIEGVQKLSMDQEHEYSIDIDFEREMEAPEQMLVMKGGRRTTTKVGDFELFGHTHPGQSYPQPSNVDLRIMHPLQPEFIVAQNTGKTIILNIEDYDKWYKWKESGKDISTQRAEFEWGRNYIFNETGIKIYPMVKNLKIELRDDRHPEKQFPRVSKDKVIAWHTGKE